MKKDKTAIKRLEYNDLDGEQWILHEDEALNENGSEAGVMLISPKEHKIHYTLRFRFQAYNNEQNIKHF